MLFFEKCRSPSENDLKVLSNAQGMSSTTKISAGILPATASADDGYYTRPRFIFHQRTIDQTYKFIYLITQKRNLCAIPPAR